MWKHGLIRKLRLILKLMTPQPGKQTTTIHILSNISRSKVKDSEILSFFKSRAENEAGILVPDLFLFLRKALFEVKENGLHLNFTIFRLPLTWTYNKNKLYKTSGC